MTVRDLLKRLTAAACVPTVDGPELVFDREPPAELVPFVALLATGLRAAVAGRKWFGIDESGHGVGAREYGALDPGLRLPRSVVLLSVEGEAGWDRLPPNAANEHPTRLAFDPPAAERKARSA